MKYDVPYSLTIVGTLSIEAESEEEAKDSASNKLIHFGNPELGIINTTLEIYPIIEEE